MEDQKSRSSEGRFPCLAFKHPGGLISLYTTTQSSQGIFTQGWLVLSLLSSQSVEVTLQWENTSTKYIVTLWRLNYLVGFGLVWLFIWLECCFSTKHLGKTVVVPPQYLALCAHLANSSKFPCRSTDIIGPHSKPSVFGDAGSFLPRQLMKVFTSPEPCKEMWMKS